MNAPANGSQISFMRKGSLVRATVKRRNAQTVTATDEQGLEWRVPYHMLLAGDATPQDALRYEEEKIARETTPTVLVGQKAQIKNNSRAKQWGGLIGTVAKVNVKTAALRLDQGGTIRVPFDMLIAL